MKTAPFFVISAKGASKSVPAMSRSAGNESPAQRVRFGKEEQQRERALTYKISRSKRYKACSDVVGVSGFEPEASWTRTKRDTKLRHTPM